MNFTLIGDCTFKRNKNQAPKVEIDKAADTAPSPTEPMATMKKKLFTVNVVVLDVIRCFSICALNTIKYFHKL